MRPYMPTRPRSGRDQATSASGTGTATLIIARTSNRDPQVLEIPERPPAADDRECREVVGRGRRFRGPLERPRIPGIVPRARALEVGPDQVGNEHQRAEPLEHYADRHQEIPRVPTAPGLVGVYSPRHAEKPGDVHAIERQVEADEEETEVQPAERLAVQPSREFREPVIEGGEYREEDCAHDDVVKVRDDEVRIPEVPIERRGAEHDPGESGDEELEQEGRAKEHRRPELNLAAHNRSTPFEEFNPD